MERDVNALVRKLREYSEKYRQDGPSHGALDGTADLLSEAADALSLLDGTGTTGPTSTERQVKLYYGWQETEDGVYHAFIVADPDDDGGDGMGEALAELLDVEPDSDAFDWNSMFVEVPESFLRRMAAAYDGRSAELVSNGILWASEASGDVLHDMLRGMGVTPDELEALGFPEDGYPEMHGAVSDG